MLLSGATLQGTGGAGGCPAEKPCSPSHHPGETPPEAPLPMVPGHREGRQKLQWNKWNKWNKCQPKLHTAACLLPPKSNCCHSGPCKSNTPNAIGADDDSADAILCASTGAGFHGSSRKTHASWGGGASCLSKTGRPRWSPQLQGSLPPLVLVVWPGRSCRLTSPARRPHQGSQAPMRPLVMVVRPSQPCRLTSPARQPPLFPRVPAPPPVRCPACPRAANSGGGQQGSQAPMTLVVVAAVSRPCRLTSPARLPPPSHRVVASCPRPFPGLVCKCPSSP